MTRLCGPHAGQHRLDHVDRAEVVGVEQRPHLGVVALLDRGQVAVAGVVDQHVDPAERLVGRGDGGGDLGAVGDVERDGDARGRRSRRRSPAPPRCAGRSPPPVAGLERGAGDLAPDAGRAAGDEPAGHLRPSLGQPAQVRRAAVGELGRPLLRRHPAQRRAPRRRGRRASPPGPRAPRSSSGRPPGNSAIRSVRMPSGSPSGRSSCARRGRRRR